MNVTYVNGKVVHFLISFLAIERPQRGSTPHYSSAASVVYKGQELRLGVARPVALRHLADRTGVEEIRAFATMLVHTERLGTGVAEALRVHAQALRQRRQRRAEEEAAKLPVKLLFPLIFTLFPALLVVLMGPAVISLMRQLAPMVGGSP